MNENIVSLKTTDEWPEYDILTKLSKIQQILKVLDAEMEKSKDEISLSE